MMLAWDIYLYGVLIDTKFFEMDKHAAEVYSELVDIQGYSEDIELRARTISGGHRGC